MKTWKNVVFFSLEGAYREPSYTIKIYNLTSIVIVMTYCNLKKVLFTATYVDFVVDCHNPTST